MANANQIMRNIKTPKTFRAPTFFVPSVPIP